jgi:hypothetical protein
MSKSKLPRNNNAAPQPQYNRSTASNDKKHWLEYAAIGLAAVAIIVSATTAGFGFWQAWIARDAEIISNRAIVISDAIKFTSYGSPGDKERWWDIAPAIENVGNTPTKNLKYSSIIAMCPGTLTQLNDVAMNEGMNWRNPQDIATSLIGPKSEVTGATIQVNDVKIICPIAVVSRGVISYDDIFHYRHFIEFCDFIRSFTYKNIGFDTYPAGQPIRIQGQQCPKHNCEDEECGADWRTRAEAMK